MYAHVQIADSSPKGVIIYSTRRASLIMPTLYSHQASTYTGLVHATRLMFTWKTMPLPLNHYTLTQLYKALHSKAEISLV